MASLSISNDEIKENLAVIMGLPRDPSNWSPEVIADIDRVIRSGRRRFFSAHQWMFLERSPTQATLAPQTVGTIAVVAGVVTLTGNTWPTDIVDNYLLVAGNGVHEVAVRTDPTHITLYDTSVNLDALSTYTLYKVRYDLPSNFASFLGPVFTENQNTISEVSVIPDYQLRMLQNVFSVRTGRPQQFAVTQVLADDEALNPTWKLTIWPLPDQEYPIKYRIRIAPGDGLSEGGTDPLVHSQFSECLAEAIYSAGELLYKGLASGPHAQKFYELLPEAIKKDSVAKGVRRLLPQGVMNRDYSNIPSFLPIDVTII